MTRRVKEIIWFLGTCIIAYLIFDPGLTFNFQDSNIDINIHDTYFVISSLHVLILFIITLGFIVYLLRMLSYKFKNLTVNIIFLIISSLKILCFYSILKMVRAFIEMAGTTVYPPLSGPNIVHANNKFEPLYNTLLFIEVILIIFEIFVVYKIITIYRKKQQENNI